jgi:hypothetical protein
MFARTWLKQRRHERCHNDKKDSKRDGKKDGKKDSHCKRGAAAVHAIMTTETAAFATRCNGSDR